MELRTIILILLAIGCCQQQIVKPAQAVSFPKILWVYWDSGFNGANLFTRLCLNNMNHFCRQSGWQFRFLSEQNYTKYISPQGQLRIKKLYSIAKYQLTKLSFSDILRLSLVYQNGGMWLDANSFFLGKLDWIDNIDKSQIVYNKINDAPDILTFSFRDCGGNKTKVIDSRTNKSVYLFPGMQFWAMIAKPKCKLLKDALDYLQYSVGVEPAILQKQNEEQHLSFDMEKDPYFKTANYLFQVVLQLKQQEIDNHQYIYKQKYAVQYYNVWTIQSEMSAYSIAYINQWFPTQAVTSFFQTSLQQYTKKYKIPPYFAKFNKRFYPWIDKTIKYNQQFLCEGIQIKMTKDSVLNQYLLKLSPDQPQIKGISKAIENGGYDLTSLKCNSLDNQIQNYINSFKTKIIILALIIAAITAAVCFCISKSKQHSELNTNYAKQ